MHKELFDAIKHHKLRLSPSTTRPERWVCMGRDITGHGPTPEDAVRDYLGRLGNPDHITE